MRRSRAEPRRATRPRRRRASASPTASLIARTSETTPVDVSDCWQKTIPRRTRARRTRPPPGRASRPTRTGSRARRAPYCSQTAIQRSPNEPWLTTATVSPGAQRFATADSIRRCPTPRTAGRPSASGRRRADGERPLVDRAEVGAAVMDDRLRGRRQHLGRHGRRAGREEVALLQVAERSYARSEQTPGSVDVLLSFAAALVALRLGGLLARAATLRVGGRPVLVRGRDRGDGLGLRPRLGRAQRSASTTSPARSSRRRSSGSARCSSAAAAGRRRSGSSTPASRSASRSRCPCTARSATEVPRAQDHVDALPRVVAIAASSLGALAVV